MYDSLNPAQRARVDQLMGQPTDQWPPALLTFINHEWTGPRRGDALAEAVATWVSRTR